MEILAPRYTDIATVAPTPGTGTALVVTDRRDIAAAAGAIGCDYRLADPSTPDVDRVAEELRHGTAPEVLVVAWGDRTPAAALDHAAVSRFANACLALLRAVHERGRRTHLVMLSDEDNVLSSLLDGMATSAAVEFPLAHTAIEFTGPVTGELLRVWLAAAARYSGARLRIAGEQITRLEYVPRPLEPVVPAEVFGPDARIVLIGGAGGVGRQLCRYLSERCGATVVVLGRGTPDQSALSALTEAGARSYVSVPAHEPEPLEEVFRYLHRELGPITAAVNLAGVLDDCLLPNLTSERLAGVLRPKAAVGLSLARLSGPHRPELVVQFSSLTSVTGNLGQVAYGAANAFLDRLTARIPYWHSVNWGLWDTDGMRTADDDSRLCPMAPQRAVDALLSLIAAGERQAVVFDGQVRLNGDGGGAAEPEPASVAADPDLPARTREWLRELVARHTGLKHLGDEDNLLDHGLDSLSSIRISRDMEARLELDESSRLSRAVLFEYPTIAALSVHLVETRSPRLRSVLTGTPPAPPAVEDRPTAPVVEHPQETATPGAYRPDDIAIIGMAGEFPNGADVEAFWQSLRRSEDAVRVIPEDRWRWRDHYSLDPDEPGTVHGRHGGFLDHALDFDPVFFTITPAEAELMDPQERRFLQVAYHALEDAGHFARPTRDVGVFVAAMYGHYQDLTAPDQVVNSSLAAIANRVSYVLDLVGPSVALDTMCSGALTALHLAAASIRAGDCALALAGGVNIMTHPGKYRLLSEGKFLSPTGRCHAFGVAADGYVPGEGTAAVLLKNLADAMRDGDRIHAVVRATAVNSGGRTAGFTVPSERAQHRVITTALNRADIEPAVVGYVEAHGTGTQLGDPIEVQALRRAYGGPEHGVAHLGTVKSNIGHLESAATMAGLVKVVKQLTQRTLVPTLHCELENPYLNLGDSRFVLVDQTRPWPSGRGLTRFAGLSSFGAGGSCGHAILQEFVADGAPPVPEFARYFIPLSGRDDAALRRRKDELLAGLRTAPNVSPYGLSYTLCCARQHFGSRCGYWVESTEQLVDLLRGAPAPPPSASVEDSTWARAARAYLDGDDPDFTGLFPVRELVDAPLYPFATERYVARSLDAARLPPPRAATGSGSLLLTPVWRPREADAQRDRPVRHALLLADRDGAHDLPDPPAGVRVVRVELPAGEEATAQVLGDLTRDLGLDHLHWVNVRREWTVESVLTFAKALGACRTPSTILTVTDENGDGEARAMAGFFQGLAEENPHVRAVQARWSGIGSVFAGGWEPVLAELRGARDAVTEVKWTDGARSVRGLEELRLADGRRLRRGGTHLLTGGLGKVGRAIADSLVNRYAATVVAVGRSAPDEARRGWLAARPGVHYERADIASAAQTRDVVARVRDRFGGLDGVIHSAGVVSDALVQNKSAEDAVAVLAPKVEGARNLDRYTADLPLEVFCVFSSISSVLGNVGQSDYIAANRFLDEFAADRARRVRCGERAGFTLSVNWPLWLDAEDARREQYEALAGYLRREFGMAPFTSQRGASLFLDLVNSVPDDCHQVLACVGDVQRLRLRLVCGAEPGEPEATAVPPEQTATAQAEVGGRLVALVRAQTGLDPADIRVEAAWGDLGYSSVMLQQLAQRVGTEFGVETPPNALFKYRSIASLSDYLRENGGTTRDPDNVRRADTGRKAGGPDPGRGGYAIVGASGVLPGGADLDGYWRLLVDNRSAVRPVERWTGRGQDYFAGVVDGFDLFDHGFFGLSAREAMLMDPQHRLFLQTAYNALLDAGHAPGRLKDVGVIAGVQFNEYQSVLRRNADWAHPYAVTGNAHTMLANRVSHLLDLTGPSQTVDTACSSGLVALNRGVLSLAAGECEIALVGAVSVLVDPDATEAARGLGVLSPGFRCATFDKAADGYVRAEGVGCVVVKRLADALRDGDSIHAVIERVAENHDGRANSLTAPNPEAQVALLERAYTADLAAQVTCIETHGTGTRLGDPIEVGALRTAFGGLAPDREPGAIALGAVKTNVGHLEPAAGLAGLLKMMLCLKNRTLPANINFHELNPLVELADSPFRLLLENEDWKDTGPLVAGVSSFGFGGSNAHVVLSEAPPAPPLERVRRLYRLVTLSARSRGSLSMMRDALLRWLSGSEADLGDIAYTLDTGRDHFEYRMGWVAADLADLRAQVAVARPAEVDRCDPGRGASAAVPPVGSGAEYRAVLETMLARYLNGEELDEVAMFGDGRYRRLSMPGYAFESNSFWFE